AHGTQRLPPRRSRRVRCSAWLGHANSQVKCNTGGMVGRGGKRSRREARSGRRMAMKYQQLNAEERSALAALRTLGLSRAEIARQLGRHRSTVGRELKRNAAPYDGGYRSARAHQRAHARRYRSRRNSHFGAVDMARVEELLREEWSPEQVSGHLARRRELAISHETIYRHVWRDLQAGGTLHLHLR